MKTLLVLSMLLVSGLAHSEVLPANKFNDVIQAIKDSLNVRDLNCIEVISRTKLKASVISWKAFDATNPTLIISENEQPAITIHSAPREDKSHGVTYLESSAKITTSSDYTLVEKIEMVQYENSKVVRKNVGTLINPKYEDVLIQGDIYQKIECDLFTL